MAGTLVATVVAVAAVIVLAGTEYRIAGNTTPGVLTSAVVTVLRVVATAAGAVCVGSLVFAVFATVPSPSGRIDVDGFAAVELAGRAGAVWTAAAFVLVPTTAVDSAGQSLTQLARPGVLGQLFSAQEVPKGWLIGAVLAGLVTVGIRLALSWAGLLGWAALGALALLPPVLAGNAGQGTNHDIATNAVIVHAVAAAVYTGALVALVAQVRRRGVGTALALRRYTVLAGVCWVALVVTGVVLAVILLPPGQIFTSTYGWLTVLTVAVTAVLGLASHRVRARIQEPGRTPGEVLRGVGLDIVLLFAALGIAEAMGRQPAPTFYLRPSSVNEVLLGYELPLAPNLMRLATLWRPDLLLGAAAVVLAVAYLSGLRRAGGSWPRWRAACWLGGCALLLGVTSSGISAYAHASFSAHMAQHMVLSMVVPPLLVLGAPVTLAAAVLPASTVPGPREWIVAVVHSRLVRALTQPAVAVLAYALTLYGLYLTDFYEIIAQYHWAHQLASVALLGTGYMLFWAVFGADEGPSVTPYLGRLGMLIALMPINALFGVIVLSSDRIIGATFYTYLSAPWVPSLAADQRLGGLISWLGGEVPMVVAVGILLAQWSRADPDRAGGQAGRAPTTTTDASHRSPDADDYERMIDALARTRR